MRILGSLILLSTVALSACAHDPGAAAPPTVPTSAPDIPTPSPAPISASDVKVENLLRWPLEGPAGFDKVEAGLQQVLQMKLISAEQFRGEGPVKLVDGYVLLFAWIQRPSGTVSIALEQTPCVSPQYAQDLIGAVQSPTTRDMHGTDYGKIYSARRNGVWVIFETTPQTYRCVNAISIRPAKESNP